MHDRTVMKVIQAKALDGKKYWTLGMMLDTTTATNQDFPL